MGRSDQLWSIDIILLLGMGDPTKLGTSKQPWPSFWQQHRFSTGMIKSQVSLLTANDCSTLLNAWMQAGDATTSARLSQATTATKQERCALDFPNGPLGWIFEWNEALMRSRNFFALWAANRRHQHVITTEQRYYRMVQKGSTQGAPGSTLSPIR